MQKLVAGVKIFLLTWLKYTIYVQIGSNIFLIDLKDFQ